MEGTSLETRVPPGKCPGAPSLFERSTEFPPIKLFPIRATAFDYDSRHPDEYGDLPADIEAGE
jgi:hypothetical protein